MVGLFEELRQTFWVLQQAQMLHKRLLLSWTQPILTDLIQPILQLYKCFMIITFFTQWAH